MPYNLLGGQYFNPIIVGVVNEIESHGGIFKTYPAVFLVILADCIIAVSYTHLDVYKRQGSLSAGIFSWP